MTILPVTLSAPLAQRGERVTLNRGHLDVAGAALPIDATDLESRKITNEGNVAEVFESLRFYQAFGKPLGALG